MKKITSVPFYESIGLGRRSYPVGSLCLVVLLLGVFFFAENVAAQAGAKAAVTSAVGRARFGVGELNQYTISIVNGKPSSVIPQSLKIEGLVIQQTTTSQNWINGRMRFDFTYTVIARKAGEFVIPAMAIEVNGLPMQTKEHRLSVFARETPKSAMDSSRPYFAVLETEVKEIYENQIIPFTMTAFSRSQMQEVAKASLEHDAIVVRRPKKLTFGVREVEGVQFHTAVVPATMFALKSGTFKVGPAEMTARIVDSRSGFVPRMLLSGMRNQGMMSNSIELNVKPLPPGAPASFTGGVGSFSMTATAAARQVTVGDPIAVEIVVTGTGNFETMAAPKFLTLQQSDWKTYEARKILDPTEDSDGMMPGKVTFSQIVIPQAEMTQIPSFELSFFDPKTGAYATRTTQPIPIQVTPDPRANQAVAPMISTMPDANGASAMPSAAKPGVQFNDILTIRTLPPNWRAMPVAATSQPLFWVAQAVPSIGLFTLLGVGLVRWIGKRAARASASKDGEPVSFAQAVSLVPAVNSARPEFYQAVKEALRAWKREKSLAERDKLSPEVLKAMDALDSRCEWLLYGAEESKREGRVSATEVQETNEILRRLGPVPPNLAKARAKAKQKAAAKPKTDDFDF